MDAKIKNCSGEVKGKPFIARTQTTDQETVGLIWILSYRRPVPQDFLSR